MARGMMYTTNGGWMLVENTREIEKEDVKMLKTVEIEGNEYNIICDANVQINKEEPCTMCDFIIGAQTQIYGNAVIFRAGLQDLTDEDINMLNKKSHVAANPTRLVLVWGVR